jgi:putative colanic acid biosynthesis acetyltransferase WcaF
LLTVSLLLRLNRVDQINSEMKKVDLGSYSTNWYKPGNLMKRSMWYFINLLFKSSIPFSRKSKILFLKLFGAKIGRGVIIKPSVNIKYPWFLEIGDNVWIGEDAWIDNLCDVTIGNNVCISQGAYIFTGSHNYKKESFDLMMSPITIEDGVWIGAKTIICPGVTLKSHSFVTTGSVVTKDTEMYSIYQGNPAQFIRKRIIE